MPSWKKIIVSGSNAELNQITSSAGININGALNSISDGLTFGDGNTGFFEDADNSIQLVRGGSMVFQANTSSQLNIGVSTLFRNTTGGFLISTGATTTGANYSFRGDENTGIGRPAADQVSVIAGGVQELIVKANTISGSASSTGSFGRVEVSSGKVLGRSTSGVSTPFSVVGGTSTSAGGLQFGAYNGDFGGIWSGEVTPATNNYALVAKDTRTALNAVTDIAFFIGDAGNHFLMNSTGVGIGTQSPAFKLDVSGTGRFTNDLIVGGDLTVGGNITAQNYIVSSSVTSIEYQSLSGSTIFGDTADDTHEFIGHVMMQSASFGMANHADRTNSNAANSYLFISQSVASKNGYVWQKAGNPGTNTFPFLLIDGANNQKASIRQDGRFSTPIVYLSNDNSGKLGEIDGDAGDSSAMYINANSRALQLSSEGKKTFKINTDGTTEIGGSGAYGVTNFGDLTVGGNLNLTSSAATLEVAGNISGSAQSTGSFGKLLGDGSSLTGISATADVVDDTSPQLGGNLDLNSNDITGTGNINIAGNLTVNGDTTTISTSNILVQDAFGFFATGSAGTNVDAGIIVQSGSFVDSGSALYHDISSERWSVGKGIASTATNVPDSKWGGFVATVYTASASPVGSSPKYGVGEIHVDDDGEIYIYS